VRFRDLTGSRRGLLKEPPMRVKRRGLLRTRPYVNNTCNTINIFVTKYEYILLLIYDESEKELEEKYETYYQTKAKI